MNENGKIRIKKCAYCGGEITARYGSNGILFFDCHSCGACVRFKNVNYPFRVQADNPVGCFNNRYTGDRKKRTKEAVQ